MTGLGLARITSSGRRHAVRRIAVFGLALAVAVACAPVSAQPVRTDHAVVDVVTDFVLLEDLVERVGGDRVEVRSLVPLGGDPHVYEPRPADAAAVTRADLVVDHGLGLAPWMEKLRRQAQGSVLTVGEAVRAEASIADGGLLDPHLWMVPPIAARYVEQIADALAEVDPGGRAAFEARRDEVLAELDALDRELRARAATIPAGRRLLVTPHDGYRYFADHFGLEVLGTLVGTTTEEQPSALRVRELVTAVRDSGVPAVFTESTVPPAMIQQVAREADVALAGPLYADSLGAEGSGVEDYDSMMRHNVEVVVDGLAGR